MLPDTSETRKEHYLYPGMLFASPQPHTVTTVLGSCISVCLWDPVLRVGGINHYMLALWNGEGLPSPKYGNIAIPKLIEKMLAMGSRKENLQAKVFGGAAVIQASNGLMNVGERNIILAEDMLQEEQIPVVGIDVGGHLGRKLLFHTESGEVFLKKLKGARLGPQGV
ncbi:MAG: chemotaxis protein CheD [Alphaproteobacteria bacterium]|uniref:Probable chemoreceptor glutamine deamidase CheD n=1 Tax=Candidatus Nitrobium versatile TaxID=2884831 RepID=A0A953J8E1_9BACT|nr:chemotaxis protein CheD [Candidatus Nitrobium versatile]